MDYYKRHGRQAIYERPMITAGEWKMLTDFVFELLEPDCILVHKCRFPRRIS